MQIGRFSAWVGIVAAALTSMIVAPLSWTAVSPTASIRPVVPLAGNVTSVDGVSPRGRWLFRTATGFRTPPGAPSDVPINPGPPREKPCPNGISAQPAPFACLTVFPNTLNQDVILRQGRSDASGPSAFGHLHALVDHNMDTNAIGKIVNNAVPVRIAGRDEYMAEFVARGQPVVRAFVRVDTSTKTEVNDGFQLGVLTGYCKTGAEAGEGRCPDFVNGTI